jgi:hypothetical protein
LAGPTTSHILAFGEHTAKAMLRAWKTNRRACEWINWMFEPAGRNALTPSTGSGGGMSGFALATNAASGSLLLQNPVVPWIRRKISITAAPVCRPPVWLGSFMN